MIKRFLVSRLKPGMYVVDPGLLDHDNQLFTVEGLVESAAQVEDLVDKGYEEVFIDSDKGWYYQNHPEEKQSISALYQNLEKSIFHQRPRQKHPVPTYEEAQRATEVYENSLGMLKDLYDDIRQGKPPDLEQGEKFVGEVMGSLANNADALVALIKFRDYDDYSYSHSLNVAILAMGFGRFLGLSDVKQRILGLSGLFHDLGKLKIPLHILNKPSELTEEEFRTMKRHPEFSCDILRKAHGLDDEVSRTVYEHHEKYCGKGYPTKKKFKEISQLAMITAHADIYDALTSRRPYKGAMSQHKALSIMFNLRGKDFEPAMTEHFVKCMGVYPVGTLVRLGGGEYAVVFATNPDNPLKPCIKVLGNGGGKYATPLFVDLADEMFQGDEEYEIVESLNPVEHDYDLKDFFC